MERWNKIIHIFRRGDRICNIAKQYKTTPYKILSDNNITNFDYIADFTPLVINIDTKCTENEQITCCQEKRGCYGCYYFK